MQKNAIFVGLDVHKPTRLNNKIPTGNGPDTVARSIREFNIVGIKDRHFRILQE